MTGLALLGQAAHLSPGAGPAGQGRGATAAAGLGGATGGPAFGQTAGMFSNAGGDVNQAITGAGDGLRLPGFDAAAAAAAAAGFPPPQRTHLTTTAPPLGAPAPPIGGAPTGTGVPLLQPQRTSAAGAPPPGQGAGPRGFAGTTAAANAGARGGPVRREYLQPVRATGSAASPNAGPTAATAATAGTSGPSGDDGRQCSGSTGYGAAATRARRPRGWRPAGSPAPARPASSVPRRSAGTDDFATTAIHPHFWPSPPPWFSR